MSHPTLNSRYRRAHNIGIWLLAGNCFMLMGLGLVSQETAAYMNGPAWLLLGLLALDRLK